MLESLSILLLQNNTLNSTIPTEVGLLSNLIRLQIFSNTIYGTIPTEIGRLQYLQGALNLSSTTLTGTVPMELGMLNKIKQLDLSNNSLTGSLPTHLANMTSLKHLNVSNNRFISFPLGEEWNVLETCDLSHNQIKQELPFDMSGIPSLESLLLSNNLFYGEIPNSLGSLARMQKLHLDNNRFSGTIPDTMLYLLTLRELNLSNNRQEKMCFSSYFCSEFIFEYQLGNIVCCDDNIVSACSDIVETDGEETFCLLPGLRGMIPAGFGSIPTLELLDLSSNYFAGNIPPEIGRLSRLKVLNLADNVLTGSIPPALGELADATVLLKGNDQIKGKNGSKIAPLSVCSNVPGFDFGNDPTWCPPERNALKKIHEEARGQEWTNATGWVVEFNDHCSWHGVECNQENNVIRLTLENGGLSGRISNAIANLTSLETLNLRDNDLKGSIPDGIGKLLNLSSLRLSYNALTGTVPDGFSSLSKLEILHIHGNRLRGTLPILALNGNNESSFIADCGSPSDFETPLECPSCTMCCNTLQECDVTEEENIRFELRGLYFMAGILGSLFVVVIASLYYRRVMKLGVRTSHAIRRFLKREVTPGDEHDAIGRESVYSFFLSSSVTGWILAILALVAQGFCFSFFIGGSTLELDSDKDWIYKFVCPRDTDDCRNTSDVELTGWIYFAIIIAVHLLYDLLNGLKLVWRSARYGLSRKSFQVFIGGLSLFFITAMAVFTSVVYNVAISRSNLELIYNTVILLFVNDIDEKLYETLSVINPRWLGDITKEIDTVFCSPPHATQDSDGNTTEEDVEDNPTLKKVKSNQATNEEIGTLIEGIQRERGQMEKERALKEEEIWLLKKEIISIKEEMMSERARKDEEIESLKKLIFTVRDECMSLRGMDKYSTVC